MIAGHGAFKTYHPREVVAGTEKTLLIVRVATPTIPIGALKAARDYAALNNSSSYIVWRNGRIGDEA